MQAKNVLKKLSQMQILNDISLSQMQILNDISQIITVTNANS